MARLPLRGGEPPPQRGGGGEQGDGKHGLVHDAEQGIAADGEEDGPVHGDVGEDDDQAQDEEGRARLADVSAPPYTRCMTPKLADYIEAGKTLDADEREIAALALQHVDEAEQAEIDAAWDEEIDRRIDEIVSGKVQLVSGRETLAMARSMLAARRNQ